MTPKLSAAGPRPAPPPVPPEPSHRTLAVVLALAAVVVGYVLLTTRCVPDVADGGSPPAAGTRR